MSDLVAILGGGVMGETLISGLLRAGWSPDEVVVSERRPERAAELADRYGVRTVDNSEAASASDTVVLVVSIAAGITTAFVEERLPDGVAVVRVMPNTPALVDQGMAAISPGTHCD